MLVPDVDGLTAQLIDVRDLAAWLVDAGLAGTACPVDAFGEPTPLADVLQTARDVAGHHGPLATASGGWLVAKGVAEWMGERALLVELGAIDAT